MIFPTKLYFHFVINSTHYFILNFKQFISERIELISMTVAAGIASFPGKKTETGTQIQNQNLSNCPLRRCCVAVIRHVCVLAAGLGLPKEIVSEEKILISLLVSCDTFFALLNSNVNSQFSNERERERERGRDGSLITQAKAHHLSLTNMITNEEKKKVMIYKLKKRQYLCPIQKSNARKLIRNIEKRYEDSS